MGEHSGVGVEALHVDAVARVVASASASASASVE